MHVVWLLFASLSAPPAAAGWQPLGPERGHVIHAAVGPAQVSVTTRVGVLTAGLDMAHWERDPRFPPEVRRVAYGPDGVAWGAPAGQIWRVGERTERVIFFESRTTPVDLAVTGSGALLAALRGDEAGVLRVAGEPERVLEGVDPWCLAADGERVLLGTTDAGVYLSTDGGASFAPFLDADVGVSAVAWVGEQAWVGLADGGLRVHDGSWRSLAPLRGGYATGIAAAGGGALITVEPRAYGHDTLVLHDGQSARAVQPGTVGGDVHRVDLTGAWALPDGRALVGSFRQGPLVWDATRLTPLRDDFRATVTGGAALDARGRLVLALMGTGVYLSPDSGLTWQSVGAGAGPVTDSVAVVPWRDGALVVDFEGITGLDAEGAWERLPHNPLLQPGQNLASVGVDAQDRIWALDRTGRLFHLDGEAWQECRQRGVRLDGQGSDLLLATQTGFAAPGDCDEPWEPVRLDEPARLDGMAARAGGGWVAGAGSLWRGSEKISTIPDRPVSALAARADEVLVAVEDGTILRCGERCEALDPAPGPVAALGWLPDGRVWAAERTGTLLIQGDGPPVPSWSTVRDARRVTGDLMPLERAPWSQEAAPQNAAPGPAQPGQQGPPLPGAGPGDRPPTASQPVPPAPAPTGSCGCGGGAVPSGLATLLGLLGWLPRRRRS